MPARSTVEASSGTATASLAPTASMTPSRTTIVPLSMVSPSPMIRRAPVKAVSPGVGSTCSGSAPDAAGATKTAKAKIGASIA